MCDSGTGTDGADDGIAFVIFLGLFSGTACLVFIAASDALSLIRSKMSQSDASVSGTRDIEAPLVSASPPPLARSASDPLLHESEIRSMRDKPSHFHSKARIAITSKSKDITQTMGVTAASYCDLVWNNFLYCLLLSVAVIPFSLVPNLTNGCGGSSPFGRTLMKFPQRDTTLWSHAICAVIVNALTALYITTYRRRLRTFNDVALALSPVRSRSVWIRVSTSDAHKGCNISKLTLQFNEAFPGQVVKIQPLGESRKLEFLWSKIQEARDSFAKLKSIKSVGAATTITIRPHRCSCSSTSVPALGYWQDEYRLWLQAALEFTNSYEESSGSGRTSALSQNWICGCAGGHVIWHYVAVFNSYEASVACLQRYGVQEVNVALPGGKGTKLLGSGKRAPEESEWLWTNVHISPLQRAIRTVFINAPLVLVAFLFSVPTLLQVFQIDYTTIGKSPYFSWIAIDLQNEKLNGLLSTAVPSLVIVIANGTMFSLLDLASKYEGHATSVDRLKSLFYKALVFLGLNILLLPATAAYSLQGIIAQVQQRTVAQFASHILVEGPSALFVSVMLQGAFIVNGFQLLHLPERVLALFSTVVKKVVFKSSEVKMQPWPFPYAYHFAYCVVMSSIVTLFSVTSPLIAPAGALFFATKLATDKYDILVLCPPDSEREAGLKYGRMASILALAALIFFNTGIFTQFLLLEVKGPAVVCGICLALSILSSIIWAGYNMLNKRKQDVAISLENSVVDQDLLERAVASDESKERAIVNCHIHPLLRHVSTLPEHL